MAIITYHVTRSMYEDFKNLWHGDPDTHFFSCEYKMLKDFYIYTLVHDNDFAWRRFNEEFKLLKEKHGGTVWQKLKKSFMEWIWSKDV